MTYDLHFKWKRCSPFLAFFSLFYLSAAAFECLRYAWVACARKELQSTQSNVLWSVENFNSVSNPRWRTKRVACSLDKMPGARHLRGTVASR